MASSSRRLAYAGRVQRVERLSASFVRVVLGGPGLTGFTPLTFTDSYVKLVFLDPATPRPLPLDGLGRLDVDAVRASVPGAAAPRLRAYTVRHWDEPAGELTLDVVVHGDAGLAGPWAAGAVPGDVVWLVGPGGAYLPDPAADRHLLVGDESALPAIAATLEHLPAGAHADVLLEVSGPADAVRLAPAAQAQASIRWIHRGGAGVGERLEEAARALPWPDGRVQAFVHGEAGFVARLRRYLRLERGMAKEDLSISGYWRLGSDDEGWRAAKKAWAAELDAAEERAGL